MDRQVDWYAGIMLQRILISNKRMIDRIDHARDIWMIMNQWFDWSLANWFQINWLGHLLIMREMCHRLLDQFITNLCYKSSRWFSYFRLFYLNHQLQARCPLRRLSCTACIPWDHQAWESLDRYGNYGWQKQCAQKKVHRSLVRWNSCSCWLVNKCLSREYHNISRTLLFVVLLTTRWPKWVIDCFWWKRGVFRSGFRGNSN